MSNKFFKPLLQLESQHPFIVDTKIDLLWQTSYFFINLIDQVGQDSCRPIKTETILDNQR